MFGKLSSLFSSKVASKDDHKSESRHSSIGATPAYAAGPSSKLFSGDGTFFFKPHASMRFEPMSGLDVATLAISENGIDRSTGRPVFLLTVTDPDEGSEPSLEQTVDQAMSLSYHHQSGAVMWCCAHEGAIRELCFRFVGRDTASQKFVEVFNTSVYKSLADPSAKTSADDEDDNCYIANTFAHQQPIRDERSPEPETQEELFTFDPRRERSVISGNTNAKNCCFADSMQYTRAIVIREAAGGAKELQALKYDANGFVAGSAEAFLIDAMKGMNIRSDKANQSLLSSDEKHLLALNTVGGIVDVDLTAGGVVAEYKPKEKYPVIAVTHRSKFADEDPNLICCLSNNVAFSIDKRMDPANAVVTEFGKDTSEYALGSLKKPMTCHATSRKGQLVIGDSVGSIRLYTGPPGTQRQAGGYHPKTAKTLLQGSPGQAILSVDITADGKFVLATTEDNVMLFPIEYLAEGKSLNGCDARMGKSKPSPLRLSPSPEQLLSMGAKPQFTSARFDTDKSGREQWIIATCNNHILTWSMKSAIDAVADNRQVASDLIKEDGKVRQVDMQGNRNTLTFMTDASIGTERRSDKPKTKGLSYFTF